MTVKDLRTELDKYDDDAKVIIIDWITRDKMEPFIGSDDENEGTEYCRIGYTKNN